MQKRQQLQQFIKEKLNILDQQYSNQHNDDMQKLKITTLRTSYSKIMQTFLKNQKQLPKSHFQQAKFYFQNHKLEQAINQAQKAKRKLSHSNSENKSEKKLAEQIDLLLVDCYIKSNKSQDALAILDQIQIECEDNQQKYLELKAEIFQELNNDSASRQTYKKLHELIIQKYGSQTVQQGLCLIKIGKNHGHFKNYIQGINLINNGMDILINNRYHNPSRVGKIYQCQANMCCEIGDYYKEYCALICAYSMIKQLGDSQEKRIIEVLNKLSSNLIRREDKVKAVEFLTKAEEIQRKIYGESSEKLTKTVKKIISLLYELNKNTEARKYQNEYDHLLICKKNLSQNNPANSQIKSLAASKLNLK